jgi:hypothetical protein
MTNGAGVAAAAANFDLKNKLSGRFIVNDGNVAVLQILCFVGTQTGVRGKRGAWLTRPAGLAHSGLSRRRSTRSMLTAGGLGRRKRPDWT